MVKSPLAVVAVAMQVIMSGVYAGVKALIPSKLIVSNLMGAL
jgi:hypothetical protein